MREKSSAITKLDNYLARFSQIQTIHLQGPMVAAPNPLEEPIVYVDGGTRFRSKPFKGISVGDGDSLELPLDETLNPDKDYSDLAYVLSKIPKNFSQVLLFGFLGGRRDHELMNFMEVHQFLKTRSQKTQVQFENSVHGLSSGSWEIPWTGPFSAFCFEAASARLTGDILYKSEGEGLRALSSHGLSNVAQGVVCLSCQAPVFIAAPDKLG